MSLSRSPRPRAKLAVLVSGAGSNLAAILEACGQSGPGPATLDAEVVLVLSNKADAYGLTRAAEAGVPTAVVPHNGRERSDYDTELAYTVSSVGADLVVLAGWLRVLTHNFLAHHPVINLHPAKPGAFPGLRAVERAFEAWGEGRITEGGAMVHWVPDEGVDVGPVIEWRPVPFVTGDTLESFRTRVHSVEHELLISSIAYVLNEQALRGQ